MRGHRAGGAPRPRRAGLPVRREHGWWRAQAHLEATPRKRAEPAPAAPIPHGMVTNTASRSIFESFFLGGEVMRRGLFIVAVVAALVAVPAAYALLSQH